MAFDGTEGEQIPLAAGAALTKEYRDRNPNQIQARFFGKDILNELLNQPGCMGIRAYFAENRDGEKELVLVGADAAENDLLDIVADVSTPCPHACSSPNALNS